MNVDLIELLRGIPTDPQLAGQPIRVMAAAEKYKINHSILSRWAYGGMIKIIESAPKFLLLDEGDVTRVVTIFKMAREQTTSRRAGWILKRVLGR